MIKPCIQMFMQIRVNYIDWNIFLYANMKNKTWIQSKHNMWVPKIIHQTQFYCKYSLNNKKNEPDINPTSNEWELLVVLNIKSINWIPYYNYFSSLIILLFPSCMYVFIHFNSVGYHFTPRLAFVEAV